MASARQTAANRENAKRSTGPRTAEGKRRSSRNSETHGLTGNSTNFLLLYGENEQAYNQVYVAVYDEWQPENMTQILLVEWLVAINWRLIRLARYEVALIAWAQFRSTVDNAALLKSLPQDGHASIEMFGCAVERIFADGDLLKKLARYERHHLGARERLIKQLKEAKRSTHRTFRQVPKEVRPGEHGNVGSGPELVDGDP
jgi:hypothetical protein